MNTPTAHCPPALLLKTFETRLDFAQYAQSADAPRFSAFPNSDAPDMLPFLGLRLGEVLFSNDLSLLQRAAIGWGLNGFEAYIEPADPVDCPGSTDAWFLRAKANIPSWFFEGLFSYIEDAPPLTATRAEVEDLALANLDQLGNLACAVCFQDKQRDQEYFADILVEPKEQQAWNWHSHNKG